MRARPSDDGRAGPLRLSNEAEPSSLTLQLAGLPLQGFAYRDGSLPALARLLVEGLIYKMNSFQPTRSARLTLAFQSLKSVKSVLSAKGFLLASNRFVVIAGGTYVPTALVGMYAATQERH